MIFFAVCRLIFLVYNQEEVGLAPWSEILSSFSNALYVDTSVASYILVISLFLIIIFCFSGKAIFLKINEIYTGIILFLISILVLAELPLYDEWAHKFTFKALWFLQQPSEVIHTASWIQLISIFAGTTFMTLIFFRLFRKTVVRSIIHYPNNWGNLCFALIAIGFLGTGMRGGYQPIPIQVSDAYFSHYNILNAASANSVFHLTSNVIQNLEAFEPYTFEKPETAKNIVDSLYQIPKDSTIYFLNTNRPNVVLVVFEGWAADVVGGLGGYSDIAPHFSNLIKQGISFDSCYASGNLSDQGMGAVFSAFPAQPRSSIVTVPNKYNHLPCINSEFKKNGYFTSFMFGGQLSYGNIRSYMYYNGFDKILEETDFESSVYRGRLGVHDGDLFDRQLKELQNQKQPFFASLFTLSTHGPYDIPVKDVLNWGDKEKEYINTVHYADSCLNHFMNEAKKQPWFNNTLFVFISDHHHNSPKNYSYYSPEYRRIPLVFYGNVIKSEFRGMKSSRICSQLDLASTLLHQLKMDSKPFVWSQNLFNPHSPEFAFYSFDEGFGWIRPEGRLVYHIHENRFESERYKYPNDKPRLMREGRAYIQRVTEEFWKY
jgi:phosphoglycerol transferase MdoB-like AlkP superfamily enzyme